RNTVSTLTARGFLTGMNGTRSMSSPKPEKAARNQVSVFAANVIPSSQRTTRRECSSAGDDGRSVELEAPAEVEAEVADGARADGADVVVRGLHAERAAQPPLDVRA